MKKQIKRTNNIDTKKVLLIVISFSILLIFK